MGIMVREQGDEYVIASDRSTGDARTNRPPRGRPSNTYEVWTGAAWSAQMQDAKTFDTLESAEEYIRANSALVNSQT